MSECELQIDIRGFIKSKINGNSHTYETGLSELIHNSIAAKATDIFILNNNYNNPIIVDNGYGMDKHSMDKLKKFYDSNIRTLGTIGTYNIGLKEALLKFGGKWIILSKKTNTEDIVYCEFNCNNLEKFANGEDFIDCIDSGFTNRTREKIFINILDELGLINKNKPSTLKKFSGTIIYQQEMKYDIEEDNYENKKTYDLLYTNLKLKLSQYNCNFIYGFYTLNDDNIIINDTLLKTIDKLDWLCWDNNVNSNEFNIIVYKTTKNTLFAIKYNDTIYKFNKKECIFTKIKSVNCVGTINVKCNILDNLQHANQELYYKDLKYKSSINGIILNRNGLDLYDYPNKYDNRYVKDSSNRKFARIFVSFIGNDDLDKIFNILPNKSLFLPNNLNNKLKNILELIVNIVYEYLDLNLQNKINLNKIFKYVLENKSLEYINSRLKVIETNYINIINKTLINGRLKCIGIINNYTLCKKIKTYYDKYNLKKVQDIFNTLKSNYINHTEEIRYINNIKKFQNKYRYIKKIHIFQKLGLCITISKLFNTNILKESFTKFKVHTINSQVFSSNCNISHRELYGNTIHLKFNILNTNLYTQKKINQLLLLKYKFLCHKYENSMFI
tara:strand:- start:7162 stop:9003 length:1842 start_codon:yes stop_codon:yes gene_type:complete